MADDSKLPRVGESGWVQEDCCGKYIGCVFTVQRIIPVMPPLTARCVLCGYFTETGSVAITTNGSYMWHWLRKFPGPNISDEISTEERDAEKV